MKTVLILLAAAAMLAANSEPKTFTGVITDSMCGANHTSMNMGADPECVKGCVRGHGAKYALFDGKNVYKLSDQKQPEGFAGRKVRITGVLYEKTQILRVDRIEAQP
ncbi:MAG: hypothetical protein IPM24_11655 [Bryobacterales bacterium]|jgi:hypothetical protein|nr:hypothetical protein [Bryobacterales bacterium]